MRPVSTALSRFVGIALFLFAAAAEGQDERPNVLFVISDDLGAQALPVYGNAQCKTPNVDRLAARGMVFNRAYCQYPVCGPSRAALMSGMYPQTIGVTGNGSSDRFTEVLGDRPSMAQLFRRFGYNTRRFSKIYHMRVPGDITAGDHGPDHAASWDARSSFHGPEWMSEGDHEHLSNERLRFEPDRHYGLGFGGAFYVVKLSTDGSEQPDVRAADRAIEYLESSKARPFFLAVGFVRPHVPLVAPERYFKWYPPETIALPEQRSGDWSDIPEQGITGSSEKRGLDTQEKKRKALAAYYASVSFMDEQLGRILDALDAADLRDNTIVVFTSDHGYHLGEHEFWQKQSLHEESTRIPLVVAGPGVVSGECDALVQQIDLYPTLAEYAGLRIPDHVQGESFAPLLKDPSGRIHDAVYCLRNESDHLIRTDRWAYIAYDGGKAEELYDMKVDPKQFTNLAADPAYSDTLNLLRETLRKKLDEIGPIR